jgi:putative PIN family toxin of toxin-antitoxin system
MKIVLDTNVLIAATRSRRGASFELLSLLPDPRFQIALSVSLYTEWQDVMTRPEHMPPGMGPEDAQRFLRYLVSIAHLQDVYYLWRPFLRDPDDDMVLECAVASGSRYLATHNLRDFQKITQLGVQPVTPAQFLALLRSAP